MTSTPGWSGPPPDRPRSHAHLQALDDAIAHRAARLAEPCPDCRPGARCDEHACDENLLDAYHRLARSAVTALREGGG
jgi:hypothetical protein